MSIYSLHKARRRARAIRIQADLLVVVAVAVLGLAASFAALTGGGIELVP